jgi:3-hydroxyisobutyrate dehydrogenase-like beta-hydroxyacid dehydrogenase
MAKIGFIGLGIMGAHMARNLLRGGLGIALSHTASAQQLFSVCAASGGKAWDHSAMVRALETMANHTVA